MIQSKQVAVVGLKVPHRPIYKPLNSFQYFTSSFFRTQSSVSGGTKVPFFVNTLSVVELTHHGFEAVCDTGILRRRLSELLFNNSIG